MATTGKDVVSPQDSMVKKLLVLVDILYDIDAQETEELQAEWEKNGRCEGYSKLQILEPDWTQAMWASLQKWDGVNLKSLERAYVHTSSQFDFLSVPEQCYLFFHQVDALQESKDMSLPTPDSLPEKLPADRVKQLKLHRKVQISGLMEQVDFKNILDIMISNEDIKKPKFLAFNVCSEGHEISIIYSKNKFSVLDVDTPPGFIEFKESNEVVKHVNTSLGKSGKGKDIEVFTSPEFKGSFLNTKQQKQLGRMQKTILEQSVNSSDKSGIKIIELYNPKLNIELQKLIAKQDKDDSTEPRPKSQG